jgi:putative membrane-bound dehydrogenase-like protein
MRLYATLSLILVPLLSGMLPGAEPKPLKVLFLGDNGHHKPADRHRELAAALTSRKIDLVYTDKASALSEKNLAGYDGLVVYANTDEITPEQEKALLDFVASGKGFIPLHCASYCFRNSPKYVELVGAQFSRHGTGTFRVTPSVKDHPITKGFGGFESWDETYVHSKHNEKDRTVLEYRESREGKEPWTWVRTHGKGRVFYTAWGHDERTFTHAGFQNLVERGIRWACGDDPASVPTFFDRPEMVGPSKDVKPFELVEAKLPFYPPERGAKSGPIGKMQVPLPPEESMKHYQHPANLELKLFASEPNFGGKPIAMNWDERGRLWVAVTVDYPNDLQREGQGNDKILICEDTNNDGLADKFTTFADKLSIPTSLTFAYGGVVVHQAPHTLFLKDTTGDDKADLRTVLFTGWNTRDTHAGPSNLRYGPDGWYYGMVGYSGFSGTVAGEQHRFVQGFYRFKLEADGHGAKCTKLEFLRGTSNNSWGVGFSEEGHLFGSTANGCASVYLPIPNRYYEKVRGFSSSVLQNILPSNRIQAIVKDYRQVDFHGGFTAAAGHALYTARAFPREYWNRTAFVCEPTGHLAATLVLKPNGTDYTASYGWNLLAGQDDWQSPIVAEVGPDGGMWVIDWYNIIVQHNPTPAGFDNGRGNAYVTNLRDKKHGRIYRLFPKGMKAPIVSLKDASDYKLVQSLKSDNMLIRLHAQRLIVEGKKVGLETALASLVADAKSDSIGLDAGSLHALWTLQALGLTDPSLVDASAAYTGGLRHASPAVRRAAFSGLAASGSPSESMVLRALSDPDLGTRLNACLRLSELKPNEEYGKAVADMLQDSVNLADRWLPDAITIAAATHHHGFLHSALSLQLSPKVRDIVAIVAEHVGRSTPEHSAERLARSMEKAAPATALVVIEALAKGWPKGKTVKLSADAEASLVALFEKLPNAGRGQLVKLASAWGSSAFDKYTAEIVTSLTAEVANDKLADEKRVSAAKQLVEFRPSDDKLPGMLLDSITLRSSPALASGFIEAVSNSTANDVGVAITTRYPNWPPSTRNAALRVLLSKPDSTRALLNALEAGTVPIGELVLDQKQALASHPDAAIAKRAKAILAKGGGLPNADRQKVVEELLPITKQTGDPAAGKLMFTKHCAACHQHSGEGTKIGPDLTGMAVHPKEELLIHIIDPSRSVEGNFRLYQVSLNNESVLNGMLASETKTSVELIDAQAKRHVLLREDIDSIKASTKSLMPEGFEKSMNVKEMTDLLEFLTKKGKYLPIPLDKAATIVSTKGMFNAENATIERLVFSDWKPKLVGEVPFVLIDPAGDKVPNVIQLHSTSGEVARRMPKSAIATVNSPANAVHILGGVSGWGYPLGEKGSVSMKVRLHYDDAKTEDHDLINGEHLADYIRRVDVPGSKFAFNLNGRQVRFLTVTPKRENIIKQIEFVKGSDATAPVVVAVTIEGK